MYGSNSGRKGGPHDDVAQNIKNEQMTDAAPSPEEAKRQKQRWLNEQGCKKCDESNPDNLEMHHPRRHECSAHQQAPIDPIVVCSDCKPDDLEEQYRQDRFEDYRHSDVIAGIVIFECGIVEPIDEPETPTMEVEQQVGVDDDGRAIFETTEVEMPSRNPAPKAPVHCECGEPIDEIRLYEDDD